MKKMNNKGFSLIELIIVIAIMAVLVAVIAPNLTGYIGKSKANADKSNADTLTSTISNALQDFVTDDTMGYAKADPSKDTNGVAKASEDLKKMDNVNDLLKAAKDAESGSFLKNVENALAKYIVDGKIDPKVKANTFAMSIDGSYDTGYTCIVTAESSEKATTKKAK